MRTKGARAVFSQLRIEVGPKKADLDMLDKGIDDSGCGLECGTSLSAGSGNWNPSMIGKTLIKDTFRNLFRTRLCDVCVGTVVAYIHRHDRKFISKFAPDSSEAEWVVR